MLLIVLADFSLIYLVGSKAFFVFKRDASYIADEVMVMNLIQGKDGSIFMRYDEEMLMKELEELKAEALYNIIRSVKRSRRFNDLMDANFAAIERYNSKPEKGIYREPQSDVFFF